jgi:hypothetical protein
MCNAMSFQKHQLKWNASASVSSKLLLKWPRMQLILEELSSAQTHFQVHLHYVSEILSNSEKAPLMALGRMSFRIMALIAQKSRKEMN